MTVAELEARMSAREFAEWIGYLARNPPLAERMEYMLALNACTTLNATGRMKNPAKVSDFLPSWGPRKRQSVAEMKHLLMMASSTGANRAAKTKPRKAKK